ncbi:MAG TPA: type IIL restriction-modification enzyme MmeI [Stellaceae bacterium]|nr:type IIL restriction-modification enzyme MmeI [Stellaceae bacterium]
MNYQLYLIELCDLLGLARPEPATGKPERDGHVFERPVHFHNSDGAASPGFIDLHRQGCFVLETKQGCEAMQAYLRWETELPGQIAAEGLAGFNLGPR